LHRLLLLLDSAGVDRLHQLLNYGIMLRLHLLLYSRRLLHLLAASALVVASAAAAAMR
jgi:hypothetical protein